MPAGLPRRLAQVSEFTPILKTARAVQGSLAIAQPDALSPGSVMSSCRALCWIPYRCVAKRTEAEERVGGGGSLWGGGGGLFCGVFFFFFVWGGWTTQHRSGGGAEDLTGTPAAVLELAYARISPVMSALAPPGLALPT